MEVKKSVVVFIIVVCLQPVPSKYVCPQQCDCDIIEELKTVSCINHNIIDVNLKIPPSANVYDLSYNSIAKIEDNSFKYLGIKSLYSLNLSHNIIFWFGLHAFSGLENLRYLNLSYNRIQALPADLFWYNQKLEILDLSGNKFLRIANKPFISHSALRILNLMKSQISFLPPNAFEKLPNLEVINLSENYMIEMNSNLFAPLSRLKKINLSLNPWRCGKRFEDFQTWLDNGSIQHEPQCNQSRHKKMFEKMVMLEEDKPTSIEAQELDELWNDEIETHEDLKMNITVEASDLNVTRSLYETFNERVPSVYGLIIGLEVGFVLGSFGMYCWLAKPVECKRWKSRRNVRRQRRIELCDGRDLLLNHTFAQDNFATPPVVRRQMSTCRSDSWEIQDIYRCSTVPINENNASRNVVCPETPPPGYQDALHDIVLSSGRI